METPVVEATELSKAMVRRVVKETLAKISPDFSISLHNDSVLAFSESIRIFIHYLTATASDICKESKRQTLNTDDVLKALSEIEFSEFAEPLKTSLFEFKQKNSQRTNHDRKKKRSEEEADSIVGTSKTNSKKGR